MDLKTCFVIQRFDGGVYDKRYRETFAPAIEKGGAKPVRADEVLGTRPVVEKIEEGLRAANVAFAEISEDNPNVFLELGFALALSIPIVIVCDKARRSALPFDIAHRSVTFYSTDAQSDYEKISREVEKAISAALLETRANSQSTLVASDGLDIDDVKGACLLVLLEQSLRSPSGAVLWEIQKEVAQAGISERMTALAVTSLMSDKLIQIVEREDQDGDIYHGYILSESGTKYLLRSYSTLMQQEKERLRVRSPSKKLGAFDSDLEDDIPF
jgi:hypothetical protein